MKFSIVYLIFILLVCGCNKPGGSESSVRKFDPTMRKDMTTIGNFINNQKDVYSKGYRGSLEEYDFPKDQFAEIDLSKYVLVAKKGESPASADPIGFISEKLDPNLEEIFVMMNTYEIVRLQGTFNSTSDINKALQFKSYNDLEKAKFLIKDIGLTATSLIRYSKNGSPMKSCYVSREDKELVYTIELEYYGAKELILTLRGDNTDKLLKAVEELLKKTIKSTIPEKIQKAIIDKKNDSVWINNAGIRVESKKSSIVVIFDTRPQKVR